MHRNQASIQCARADRHIVFGESCKQFVGFFNRRGKIRVREQHILPARFLDAVAYAIPFAAIFSVRHDAKQRYLRAKRLRDRSGLVLRTIVDH